MSELGAVTESMKDSLWLTKCTKSRLKISRPHWRENQDSGESSTSLKLQSMAPVKTSISSSSTMNNKSSYFTAAFPDKSFKLVAFGCRDAPSISCEDQRSLITLDSSDAPAYLFDDGFGEDRGNS